MKLKNLQSIMSITTTSDLFITFINKMKYKILKEADEELNLLVWEHDLTLYLNQKGEVMLEFRKCDGDCRVEKAEGNFKVLYSDGTEEVITQ